MALTSTTLTSAISATQLRNIAVASTTGFTIGQPLKIDNEYMYIVSIPSATAVTVRMRGAEGTPAVAHDILATVVTSATAADFPAIPTGFVSQLPPMLDDVATIGQDVTVTVPSKNTTYLIQKASAAAITLTSGTAAQLGTTMTFISQTGYAHVLTYAPGLLAGANTVATLSARQGASLVVQVSATGLLAVVGGSDNVTYTL